MNYGLCPHGLTITTWCDLCSQKAAQPRALSPDEANKQGWLCPRPSPMTITVLKRALELSPNVLSDPHGSGPADAARAWLESLSEPAKERP